MLAASQAAAPVAVGHVRADDDTLATHQADSRTKLAKVTPQSRLLSPRLCPLSSMRLASPVRRSHACHMGLREGMRPGAEARQGCPLICALLCVPVWV